EHLVHVQWNPRRRLKERDSPFPRQILAVCRRYRAGRLEVTLVAHEDDRYLSKTRQTRPLGSWRRSKSRDRAVPSLRLPTLSVSLILIICSYRSSTSRIVDLAVMS